MFHFLKKIIKKEIGHTKFSTTITDATEGSNTKADLNPNIKRIIDKINSDDKITNEDLNNLITFYFNKPPIEHYLYKLNKSFSESMCFEISRVNTFTNDNNDLENIVLHMKEVTFNAEFSILISVKDFYEFLTPLELKPETKGKQLC